MKTFCMLRISHDKNGKDHTPAYVMGHQAAGHAGYYSASWYVSL